MTGGVRRLDAGTKSSRVKRAAVSNPHRGSQYLEPLPSSASVVIKPRSSLPQRLLASVTPFHPRFFGIDVEARALRNTAGLFCFMANLANRNRTRLSSTSSPYNLLYLVTNRTPFSAHFAVDPKCRSNSRTVVELGLTLGLSFVSSLTVASIWRTEEKPFGFPDPVIRCPLASGNARAKYRCRSLRHARLPLVSVAAFSDPIRSNQCRMTFIDHSRSPNRNRARTRA